MIEKMEDQRLDHDMQFTKTSPEPLAPTKERTSGQSSKRQRKSQMKMPLFLDLRKANGHTPDASFQTDGRSLGEYMMPNFGAYLKEESGYVYSLTLKGKPQERYFLSCGEKPNIEMPSRLSQILEQNPDPKYNLSEKACLGILRRAEKRGKVLPPMLDQALRRQAGLLVSRSEQESQGGGKGILIQNERTGALSTLNNQSVVYGISSDSSNAMRSSNPNSGIYEAETTRTLDNNGGNPACNQGGMAVVQGADMYNGTLTGDIAATLNASSGDSPTHSGPSVVCLEGNGSRPSHKGTGFAESDTMYTLNSTEHHAVCAEPIPINTMVGTRTTDEKRTTFGVGDSGDPQFTLSSAHSHAVAVENHPADSRVKISEDGICQTLSSRMGTGGGNVPMVMEPILLESNQNHATIQTNGISTALPASMGMGGGYVPMVMEPISFGNGQLHDAMSPSVNVSKTLNCMDDPAKVVTYGLDRASFNQGQNAQYNFSVDEEKVGMCVAKGPNAVCKAVDCLNGREKDVNGTLAANARKSLNSGNVVRCESVVRRLTPLECTRLQGFPDGWVDIGDWVDSKGKKHKGEADSPRYKALGNSLALPFWNLLAGRICKQYNKQPTMGSLFSGIGGFELVFQNNGALPVWSSEVEEFAIAVTKKRFQEGED